MTRDLSCDVLVVGTGAMGLAFADELHAQRPDDTIVLVDRRAKPGGHWNDAYRFVSLHQPAAFYGVNSLSLGPGGAALASGSEVLTYYELVLDRLVASGKVRVFPQCEFRGDGEIVSLLAPDTAFRVEVRRKTVDSTYMNVEVPSTTPPKYEVAEDASLIPPNGLPQLRRPAPRYVVIGAGKTGMDAVLFLLDQGVEPDVVSWVVPNDAWLLDRDTLTPGRTLGWFVGQLELIAAADSLEEVFLETEKAGSFLRLDPAVWPTKFRCATVNRQEIESLRRVKDVVREGRVRRVARGRLELEGGELSVPGETVFVDCTADGLARRNVVPVFDGDRITLQSLFMCQQVFSAALAACIECRFDGDEQKNALAVPVPHPEVNRDYLTAMSTSNQNFDRWSRRLSGWLRRSRLALPHHEPLHRLLLNTYRAKRVGPPALEAIERIQARESSGAPS